MGKSAMGTSVAAACAAYGAYKSVEAFVPGVAGNAGVTSRSTLRGGIADNSAGFATANMGDSTSSASTLGMASMVGVVACAAVSHQSGRARTSLRAAAAEAEVPVKPVFDPAVQPGVTAPLGFFDPLGFCKKGDEAAYRNLRSAEIKHGRVAMMAAIGAVFQHYVQFPGFQDVPKGLAAVTVAPGMYGFGALFLISGAVELLVWKDDASKQPGDFGNPLSLEYGPGGAPVAIGDGPRNRELNNGRMAMFSILGIMVAELATGKDAMEQFGI